MPGRRNGRGPGGGPGRASPWSRPGGRGAAGRPRQRASHLLKEEKPSHDVPETPGRGPTPRLGTRSDHPSLRVARGPAVALGLVPGPAPAGPGRVLFATAHSLDWGDSFHAVGTILNQGNAA